MREIIFDTETTGLDPASGDRMVEIGCIEMVGRVVTGRTYHAYFNPERTMPREAEAVHGLNDQFLSDKPRFADQVDDLLAFLGDAPLVAHNAGFDFGFLDMELVRCGYPPVDRTRMIDTVALAKQRHPMGKWSLDALCTRYGIDRSHRVRHGALLDAELLAQVYVELTGGRQIGLMLESEVTQAPDATGPATGAGAGAYAGRAPRFADVPADEAARHAAFVATLTHPLWLDGPARA